MSDRALFWTNRSTTGSQSPVFTGGATGEEPTLVQSKAVINSVTATLPSAPTPGNLLVAICSHWNNLGGSANGFTLIQNANGAVNAGVAVATKFVQPGDSATQTPFSVGGTANTMTLFEVEGAQAVTFVNFIKESAANPATVTGWCSPTDLLVGMFVQQIANDPFTLSGDVTTPIENITGTAGADSPYRLQSFSYQSSDVIPSVTATLTAAASARMIGMIVCVSSQPAGVGRVVVADWASAASMGTRWPVGDFYFEMDIVTLAGTPGVGFVDRNYGFSFNALGQGTSNMVYNSNGQVRFNNATVTTLAPFVAGDRIGVAVSVGQKKAWFRVNNGSWNNDGLANPVTGVGGIDLTSMAGLALAPAVSFSVTGTTMFARFASEDWIDTEPTGFYSADDTVVPAAWLSQNPEAIPYEHETEIQYRVSTSEIAPRPSFPAGPVEVLAGEVRENDVGVQGRLVRVHAKGTGDLIGEFRTAPDGSFIIPVQNGGIPHYIIAFDDPEGEDYNAKIFDNVMPG